MYEPVFNSVLVEIDDEEAKYGSGNDDSMLGKVYSRGKVIRCASPMETADYPDVDDILADDLQRLVGKNIIWNEGADAGTHFEFDGKLFGMIYWHDIRAVKVDGLTEAELNKQFDLATAASNPDMSSD